MTPEVYAELLQDALSLQTELSQWRRFLHQYPELSGDENGTAAFVAGKLEEMGVEGLQTHFAGTAAVIAEIRGAHAGPTVALRADMDALPILEKNEFDFASQNTGVMHACGHDAHTTVLLGAAQLLMQNRQHLHGVVRLIFQPAEEVMDQAGAAHLVQAGVLDSPAVAAIFGLHVYPDLPVGEVATRPGPMMASADIFEIQLHGKGTHASRPHQGIDTVLLAAEVISSLHHIVSRRIDPLHPAVLTIGRVEGGKADNVIPDRVVLGGTVRTLDPELQAQIPHLIEKTLWGLCEAYGGRFEMTYQKGTAPVHNHPEATEFCLSTLRTLLGDSAVRVLPEPSMGGEDFGEYLKGVPGTFFRLGVRNQEKGITAPLHSAYFNLDEGALPIGAAAMAALALQWLAQAPAAD
ncbi:amidohydrolase [bacterium (Candidatus Blackallbacteria) CG17_big_fil_post_rev_8_21_14_2_50_48_46]|uniref:Amidohydrolase n=1 Tax=bacterium (Candidatus Blackallbacteria) CG17_big_fil_post_rev_8_21_14_2_50_48_46 TaxID=2014261 RepID=A0A2M7G4H8_9BACT|nr:MAG: amidohydrolase [bacterium (Candidatus Blackallbacteria) CG18_big_fil_WC_8_21_14_2_50_49_26]PIW16813.1 MAG: amidohydrolase [bacterium (Candidatus Blackallbacteria) CG17_big_fil_post_rev_8_21_14_2_50_48_46]PIW48010.1 MAG: amidohydrolase [bacterium (Candidatus Blackallbacteria) CG13_big_fil_rev_8_21_14_2_50_49_14]